MEKVNKELKEKLALRNSAEGLGAEDEEMNQEVRDMIALGLLDKDWNKGLNKIDAKIQLNKVLSNNPSSQHIDTIPFENEEMNKEVRDMIDLGLLNKDWATGLSKTQAKIKFSQVLSNNPSSQHIGAVPFAEDEEMNQEVRDMIALGLLDRNWNKGLNKGDAKVKFNQILSNNQSCSSTQPSCSGSQLSPSNTQSGLNKGDAKSKFSQVLSNNSSSQHIDTIPFENEEMNQEVRDMIDLGLLNKDWATGLSKTQAEIKFSQVLSNNPSSQHIGAVPFENEEMNKEVRDMIDLGLLNKDWATGLSKTQAEIKFSQVLSNNPSSQHIGAVPFAEDEEMNQEVRDMIALGLLNKDWNKGLNKGDAKVKFNQILSNTQSCSSTQGSTPCSTQRPSSTQGSTPCSTQRPSSTQGSTPCSSQRSILPVNQSSSHVREKHPDKKKNYKLFPVSPDDQVFKDIFADFERCGMERKVKAIQCVENEKREKAFELDKKQLKDLHGNEYDLNIQELYHASNAPRNLICSRGLDQRLGQIGLFGRGIYFSDNVKKCEQYLEDTKGSAIYKCSVILGDMKEYPRGEKHPELKQEPPKDNGDYYDSVKGNINGFNEYIIYDNRKCLIQYRIVLEGAEDEDDDTSDIEERVAQEEEEEKKMEAWIRHVHYLVNTCTHEEEEDPLKEQEIRNIEKIRLVIRKRREIQTGETPTVVTYDLLREERKTWKKFVSKDTSHEISPQLSTRLGEVLPVEEDPIPEDFTASFNDMEQMIYDNTLSTFMEVTCCKYVDLARGIIKDKNGDLSNAIDEYYAMMY